ncbi:uncharacterized protein BDR25DRAFT_339898 [Lindgomyces ingoldianus]|uniref:Uncharacterized protein n=1 Tax=Lindgomyces ingoldianus TaxID=673940 RepID=A0ACB6RB79_9PLEO|nr:uncharacterized protein BDR25DRAFT_339898 [Lindgomyces ingoldianus]KAF2476003.1 hypothetical protein BDR25DRAFT_339898 [Lindgomyces ingoldianus]
MGTSPQPVTGLHLGPAAPKLRSSCDGCGVAKVKCDRGHPECGRCTTLHLACVYGRSRQSGKPSRKRPGVSLDGATEKRRCTLWPADSSENHRATELGEPQDVSVSTHADFSNLLVDILPFSNFTETTLSTNEQSQFSSSLYPALPLEEWPQLDGLGSGLGIPSPSVLGTTTNLSTNASSDDSHNCPRESYEIFRDLICPSPLHAPESNSITIRAQLDHVLFFNRNAVERLNRVLKCSCSKTGHRAMVHASIVSRILIWYQQAAGWSSSSSSEPQPSASASLSAPCCMPSSSSSSSEPPSGMAADTSKASSASLVQATGFAVEQVPVSMGTFGIEDQNVQAAIRAQLILSELKKMANLIDAFTSQDSVESSAHDVAGLYSHIGAWLRTMVTTLCFLGLIVRVHIFNRTSLTTCSACQRGSGVHPISVNFRDPKVVPHWPNGTRQDKALSL